MKQCTACGQTKPTDQFPPRRRVCKTCRAEYMLAWKSANPHKVKNYGLVKDFGITIEQYRQLADKQNHCCAICGQPENSLMWGKPMSLAVDHDHATGEVRGLLCGNCNNGLGRFKDDTDLLRKAIAYIEKGRPEGRP